MGGLGNCELYQMRIGMMAAVIRKNVTSCWFHVSPKYLPCVPREDVG